MKRVAFLAIIVVLACLIVGCGGKNGSTSSDTRPPVISQAASSDVTGTTATIKWNTDETATAQVDYGLTTSYGSTTVMDPSQVTSHSVSLTGLTPGATYHYRIRSTDGASNEAVSQDFTFVTVGGTIHTGTISANETWAAAGNPHLVTGNVDVAATVTVEPGVVVKFNSGTGLTVGASNFGALVAKGTAALPITFTSNAGTPSRGDWSGITLEAKTTASTTALDYCIVEYGGGNGKGGIYCTGFSPAITNCTVRESSTDGIYLDGVGFTAFSGDNITANTQYPLHIDAEYVRTLGSGNTLTGNTVNGIEITGGNITTSGTWANLGVPYIVTVDLSIAGAAGPTLTVAPGNTLKFAADKGIDVAWGNNAGVLVASGTAAAPITFQSSAPTPGAGLWDGIRFWGNSASSSVLEYCVVEHGGAWVDQPANIYCDSAAPTIRNCTIRQSAKYGVYSRGSGFAGFTGNTISTCAQYPLHIDSEYVRTVGSGNTFTGNTLNGIEVADGDVTTTGTWANFGVPYIIVDGLSVGGTAGPALTIAAGNTLKFAAGTDVDVSWSGSGSIVAQGTAASPITFTSSASTPSRGDWCGIRFWGASASASVLDYCVVEWGGSWVDQPANIYCSNAAPSITNCTIRESKEYGVYSTGSGFTSFNGNTVSACTKYPVHMDAEYVRTISPGNTLTGNTLNGIEVSGGDVTTSGTWANFGVPYIIVDGLSIGGTAGPTLTIAAGNTLKFAAHTEIDVAWDGSGAIVAQGTAASPVTFTSNASTPSRGDWYGIRFWGASASASVLDYCVVEWAGGWVDQPGNIYCSDASPTLTNCIVSHSLYYGIYLYGTSDPDTSGTTYADNSSGDVYIPSP